MVHLVGGWGNEVWIGMELYIHYNNMWCSLDENEGRTWFKGLLLIAIKSSRSKSFENDKFWDKKVSRKKTIFMNPSWQLNKTGPIIKRHYGKCVCVLLHTFLDIERITVSFDKLKNTDFIIQVFGVEALLSD